MYNIFYLHGLPALENTCIAIVKPKAQTNALNVDIWAKYPYESINKEMQFFI